MRVSLFLIICSMLFSSQNIHGQQKNLVSQVVTFDSIPIVHATIKVHSSKQIVTTDSTGRFEAVVLPDDKLLITAKGFFSAKIKIVENSDINRINLKLRPGDRNMDLALLNGHVTNSKRFKNARQINDSKDANFSQFSTFFELIEGRFPNVEVHSDGIVIRGTKFIPDAKIGSRSYALIVLDGIPSNFSVLSTLVPANITSVKIVTGAQAMKYGPDTGNGALVIVTKGLNK